MSEFSAEENAPAARANSKKRTRNRMLDLVANLEADIVSDATVSCLLYDKGDGRETIDRFQITRNTHEMFNTTLKTDVFCTNNLFTNYTLRHVFKVL